MRFGGVSDGSTRLLAAVPKPVGFVGVEPNDAEVPGPTDVGLDLGPVVACWHRWIVSRTVDLILQRGD